MLDERPLCKGRRTKCFLFEVQVRMVNFFSGSRVTNRSSSAGRRSASSHHTAAAAASNRRQQQQQQQKQQRRLLQENHGGGGVARDFYYPVNPPLQKRSLSNLEVSNLEKRAFKSRRGANR